MVRGKKRCNASVCAITISMVIALRLELLLEELRVGLEVFTAVKKQSHVLTCSYIL